MATTTLTPGQTAIVTVGTTWTELVDAAGDPLTGTAIITTQETAGTLYVGWEEGCDGESVENETGTGSDPAGHGWHVSIVQYGLPIDTTGRQTTALAASTSMDVEITMDPGPS